MTTYKDTESEVLNLFRRMKNCAELHSGDKDEWIDGTCVTPNTATNEVMTIFKAHIAENEKRIEERSREALRAYSWSSDKDYQLAVIAFREILGAHRKETTQ